MRSIEPPLTNSDAAFAQVETGETPRRDPAPSRWAYRFQRYWLTPLYRRLLRVGVPVAIVLGGAWIYFADPARQAQVTDLFADLRAQVEDHPMFRVNLMRIEGASPELADSIREVLPLDFPISSFDLDADAMWRTLTELDPVASAKVQIEAGGVLKVEVVERVPAILWRGPDGVQVWDRSGAYITDLDSRLARPDLPIIAGAGASDAVAEAFALFSAAQPIAKDLRGLVRVGERRWTAVLQGDRRILLPAEDPVPALERVIALNQAQEVLERDIYVVDMRNPRRPTLRLNTGAVSVLKQIRGINGGQIQ